MPQNGFDTKLVKDLAKILRESDLSDIEIEYEGTKIRVSKQINLVSASSAPQAINYAAPASAPAPTSNAPTASVENTVAREAKSGNIVTSPMVGTVYFAPEPNAKPFISIGDTVKKGQQLFIVEAMKTLNAVNSEFDGVVKEILVRDAHPVEFGEQLCIIE